MAIDGERIGASMSLWTLVQMHQPGDRIALAVTRNGERRLVWATLKALDGIMAMPADTLPGERRVVPDQCLGRLRMEGLRFGYSQDAPALAVDALQMRPGERVAVLICGANIAPDPFDQAGL